MEAKNASAAISDREFIALLEAARRKDEEAMLRIIALFQEDIEKASKYIALPAEDAAAHIVLELLEMVRK